MSLVRNSLQKNTDTVVSIFVNPAQFAPHEDLGTYPRTIESDLRALESLDGGVSAVFLPPVGEMYPSGSTHGEGTFVEVVGPSSQMEGKSRPGFFRGVATVVTKLLNIVQVSFPSSTNQSTLLINPPSPISYISVKKIFNRR